MKKIIEFFKWFFLPVAEKVKQEFLGLTPPAKSVNFRLTNETWFRSKDDTIDRVKVKSGGIFTMKFVDFVYQGKANVAKPGSDGETDSVSVYMDYSVFTQLVDNGEIVITSFEK